MDNKYIQALANAIQNMRPRVDVVNEEYTGENGQPRHLHYAGLDNGDLGLYAGSYGDTSAPTYYAEALLPGGDKLGKYIPDFDRNINTLLGNIELDSNYDMPNMVDARFTPNAKTNNYIQALASILNGQR